MQTVMSAATLLAILTDAVDTDGVFETCKLGLVETEDPITPGTALADVQLAQYTGYANSAAVVWGTPHKDDAGGATVQAGPKEFKPSGTAATSTVNQVVLLDSAGAVILASYKLDEPLQFSSPDDVYLVGFPLSLAQPSTAGENVVP